MSTAKRLANPDLLAQETKPMGETVAYFTHDLRRDYSIFRSQQLDERTLSTRTVLGHTCHQILRAKQGHWCRDRVEQMLVNQLLECIQIALPELNNLS
jgi:hypothetical protein